MPQNKSQEVIQKYRQASYDMSCSEATLHALNEIYHLDLDPKAMSMMAGFSGGLMTEDLCGVISASVAALSVALTKGVAHQSPELKEAVLKYLSSTDAHFCSRKCADIKATHRDQVNKTCNPVIFQNMDLISQVFDKYGEKK